MNIKLWTKQKYSVENKEGDTEYHYTVWFIGFRSKDQSAWVLLYSEDWCRILVWAENISLWDYKRGGVK